MIFADSAKLTYGRTNQFGNPVPPTKTDALKWTLIAAVCSIAAALLIGSTAGQVVMGVLHCSTVVGIPTGLVLFGGALFTSIFAFEMLQMAIEASKNAHHHLKGAVYLRGGHRLGHA